MAKYVALQGVCLTLRNPTEEIFVSRGEYLNVPDEREGGQSFMHAIRQRLLMRKGVFSEKKTDAKKPIRLSDKCRAFGHDAGPDSSDDGEGAKAGEIVVKQVPGKFKKGEIRDAAAKSLASGGE